MRIKFCLTLFTILFTLQLPAAGLCKAIFQAAKQAERKNIEFSVDLDVDAQTILHQSLSNVIKNADTDSMLEVLGYIVDHGIQDLTEQQVLVLKATRKSFAILRSALQITSAQHTVPSQFSEFVRDLGRLNDRIQIDEVKKTQKLAKNLIDMYEKLDLKTMVESTLLADQASINEYYSSIQNKAKKLMKKNKLTVEEYHHVRKMLKEYLAYYELKKQLDPDQDFAEYNYLFLLNEGLGELNDKLTTKIIQKKSFTEDSKLEFPRKLRVAVEYFLNHLEIKITAP